MTAMLKIHMKIITFSWESFTEYTHKNNFGLHNKKTILLIIINSKDCIINDAALTFRPHPRGQGHWPTSTAAASQSLWSAVLLGLTFP